MRALVDIDRNAAAVAAALIPSRAGRSYWQTVWMRLREDKVTIAVMIILAIIVLLAVFAPLFTPHDPFRTSIVDRLRPLGSPGHWLGTDEIGRDLWARMLYGARLSLLCGVTPVLVALLVGGALGILAGFVGGMLNSAIMRAMDVLYAFPSILLAVAICGILGAGIGNTICALSLTFIAPMTRISESITTQIRSLDFVEAARASGSGTTLVLRYHILNNVLGPILVYATSLVGISVILASGLGFLGLGASPPSPEWGLMLNNLRSAIWVNPAVAALPGVMIFVTSMCFNLTGDGIRNAMDMRL
jgi:peptide/nickel transport system permease protein